MQGLLGQQFDEGEPSAQQLPMRRLSSLHSLRVPQALAEAENGQKRGTTFNQLYLEVLRV